MKDGGGGEVVLRCMAIFFMICGSGLGDTLNGYTWTPLLTTNLIKKFAPVEITAPQNASIIAVDNLLLVYGGSLAVSTLPYAWVYDLQNLTWRDNTMFADQLFNLSNCSPTNAGVTVANGEVWALGGNCGFSIVSLSFAQIFNPATWSWRIVSLSGTIPSSRYGHAVTFDSESNSIYLFGGFNGTRALKDFWQLNLATNTWTDLVSVTAAPQSEVHSTANWQDTFTRIWYVFGGRASSGNTTNQFLSFNLGFLNETKVVEGNAGAIDALGSMIPLLPYSIGPSQYTSLALIGGTSNVGLQLWNESSRDWTSAQISAQLRNSLPTTIPSGNTYGIYAIDLQTPTVFQLLPGNNSNTNTAFLVAPPSSQSSISVIFPTDEPTVSITPIANNGEKIVAAAATLGFGEIAEINPKGDTVHSLPLSQEQFAISTTRSSATGISTYTFQAANKSIVLEFEILSNDTTFQSASVEFLVSRNAVKLSLAINYWLFQAQNNTLQVRLPFSVAASTNLNITNSTQDQIRSFIFQDPQLNSTTIIRCLLLAEIDGSSEALIDANIVAYLNETGFLDLRFPSFQSFLSYDPDFSVVLEGAGGDSGVIMSGGDGGNTPLIVGLSVGLGVGIPLMGLFIFGIILAIGLLMTVMRRRRLGDDRFEEAVSF